MPARCRRSANVKWVRGNGLGIVVRSFRKDIAGSSERRLRHLARYKANIEANVIENRAVFEIVERIASSPTARPVRMVSSLALEG